MSKMRLLGSMLLVVACGGDDGPMGSGESDGGGADVGEDGVNAEESGEAPAPGPSAEGWMSSWVDGGSGFDCDATRADLESSGAPGLGFGDTSIFVGFEQVGDNQNPLVIRFDGDERVYCQKHETEGPDGRALGITWDGGEVAYVVYTIVGGGSSLESATQGGWLPAYAPGAINGGGPKVSYVGRVDVADGSLMSGTFVIAVKSDNKVNSHGPSGPITVLGDGNVEFLGSSAHKPIDIDWEAMDCTDYPFESRYVLSPDLSTVVCAECTNCQSQQPCG